MTQWLLTFKQNHLKVIDGLKKEKLEWRLVLAMLVMMIVSLVLVYVGVQGQTDMLLQELFTEFDNPDLEARIRGYLIPAIVLASIFAEVVWALIWGWVTFRIMKRLTKPLRFAHILNIFFVARLYEMALGIAILLGTVVVGIYLGKVDVLVAEDGGGAQAVLGLLTTVAFVWIYVWSIRYVADVTEVKK